MRLFSFQIKGFKSIIDTGQCKISETDNIVVLAGQNEAGKTAVLEALDFFRNGPSENFDRLQARLDTTVAAVICTFVLEEADILPLEINQMKDGIGDFLKKNKHVSFIREHVKGSTPKNIRFTEESEEKIKMFLRGEGDNSKPEVDEKNIDVTSDNNGQTKIQIPADASTELEPDKQATPASLPSQTPEPKTPIFDDFSSKLINSIPPFTLYTSFKDLLPSDIPISDLSKDNAVKDFQKVFDVDLNAFAAITDPREKDVRKREIEKKATDDFKKFWTQTISSIEGENEYSFSIDRNDTEKKIIFMIKGRDENPLYLEQKSLGFRWFSAFHLRLRAMMKDEMEANSTNNNKTRFILLIDEPGQNLHDIAQKDVKNIIEETARKNIQVIYSTHNPNLIGTEGNEFTRIRLVSNEEKVGTKVENVAQFISKTDRGSLDALSPIRTAMGLVSIDSIFDATKYNVVVEGITDHYYLSAFKQILQKDERIMFVPACGVDNVKHVVSVLIGWGCSYKAVFDDDPSQGRKAYNHLKKHFFEDDDGLAHEHIFKLTDKRGIEDLFLKTDFETLVLPRKKTEEEKGKDNSEIAKGVGKEMLARQFLERVENKEIIDLKDGTKKNIEAVFKWIYEKFDIP